jgi:hypothetical protein
MIVACPSCTLPFQVLDDQIAPLVQTACPHCGFRLILDFAAANDPSLVEPGMGMASGWRDEASYRASRQDASGQRVDASAAAPVGAEPSAAPVPSAPSPARAPAPAQAPAPAPAPAAAPAAAPPAEAAATPPARAMAVTPAAPIEPASSPEADADFGRRTLISTGPVAPARPPARTPTAPSDFTPPVVADLPAAENLGAEAEVPLELDTDDTNEPGQPDEPASVVRAEPSRVPPHTPPMAHAPAGPNGPTGGSAPAAMPPALMGAASPAELSQPRGSVAEIAAPLAPPTSLAPPEKKKRSRVGLFLLIGLLLVVGGLVGAAFALTGDPNPIPFIQSLLEP